MAAKILGIVWCSRLAGSQLCRPRRIFFLLILSSLITGSLIFYGRVQEQLALCQNKDQWQCSLEALQYSEDEEPIAKVPVPDSSPIVKTPEPNKSWFGVESLEDVYGVVSDAIKKPGILSEWRYDRDANDTSMSRRQCQLAFPEIYKEIVRTQAQYSKYHIVEQDLDLITMLDGRVRAGIYNGKLFILKTSLTAANRPKALGVLQSINTAISNPGPNSIPNIEFVFSVDRQVRGLASPIWVFDREEENDKVWLMPSPGFVWEGTDAAPSAKSAKVTQAKENKKVARRGFSGKEEEKATRFKPEGSKQGMIGVPRDQLVAEVETIEGFMSFGNKTQRLIGVWRNTSLAQNARHKALSRAANGHSWAENDKTITTEFALKGLDALNRTTSRGLVMSPTHQLSLSQMCRFGFLGHDSSFAIPVADGPLLCASVLLTTKPKWIELYHGLMRADLDRFDMGDETHPVVQAWAVKGAGEQNVVVMADDFGDLSFKMDGLMKYPDVAETIANNSRKTFRERYLTKAATACYWRELMRGYSAVSYKPGAWKDVVKRDGGGDPAEVKRSSRRGIRWESFLMLDDDSQMTFDDDEFGDLFNENEEDEEDIDYLL